LINERWRVLLEMLMKVGRGVGIVGREEGGWKVGGKWMVEAEELALYISRRFGVTRLANRSI
jgi:hypothetical protein